MKTRFFLFSIALACCFSVFRVNANEWRKLLDADLSQWEIWFGVPHKASGIEGYENVTDVRKGKPLGLGNRRNIFSVIEEDGEQVLKITGEIFGSLATKEEFENYHLTFQVKWGEKKWEPRLKATRNNGVLYHSIGNHGTGLWGTWMSSLEFEVEETNFGDFIAINDQYVRALCPSVKKSDGRYYYSPEGTLKSFNWTDEDTGRCFKRADFEKPFGEWNTLELICVGDTALHIINGELVMVVYKPEFFDGLEWQPMQKGKLQLQSEAAETYFRDIRIKSISEMPQKWRSFLPNG